MHPHQRDDGDEEEQHEAARPQAGQVVQHAENQRQDEAAQPADHAHKAADRAHAVGVVDRNVLVDRSLAQSHEEAEDEDRDGEAHHTHFHMEGDGAIDALHHIIGGRIGQHEGGDDRDDEGPVHHPPCAIHIGQMAAIGAEQAGGHGEEGRDHARAGDVQPIDLHQILRQPQRQRHECAEHEEIVEGEAPDLNILQRLQLQPGALGRTPVRRRSTRTGSSLVVKKNTTAITTSAAAQICATACQP